MKPDYVATSRSPLDDRKPVVAADPTLESDAAKQRARREWQKEYMRAYRKRVKARKGE